MLEQMLKAIFESDKKAASGSGSEQIKANVLSRIESEKPMKHIRIKPLIIAAAVSVVGIMSAVLTANASTNPTTSEEPSKFTSMFGVKPRSNYFWNDGDKEHLLEIYDGDEYMVEMAEIYWRRCEIAYEYYNGKISQAKEIGEIKIEKELDEIDVTGFVEPYRVFSDNIEHISELNTRETEKQLELVKQLEEDPESFGLIPIGKSETFDGGLRIVNRHFENVNESADGEKIYYSFRRVYTDDSENRLLASFYLGCQMSFPFYEQLDCNIGHMKQYLNIVLDHTEEGCFYGYGGDSYTCEGAGGQDLRNDFSSNSIGDCTFWFSDYDLKSLTGDKAVTVGATIAVTDDGIQLLD